MNKRNIKKLIESMQGKKKKKTSKKMSAVKEALIGRKYFSKRFGLNDQTGSNEIITEVIFLEILGVFQFLIHR